MTEARMMMCCFVLLAPTPEEYRVPRVSPGVTASKLFPPLLPSLATPGPPLPYRPLQNARYALSEVQSGVLYLLGLVSGLRRGGRGIPIRLPMSSDSLDDDIWKAATETKT